MTSTQRVLGSVVSLWRYPVKSMMEEEVNARPPNSGYWAIAFTRSSTAPTGRLQAPRTRGSGPRCSTSALPWVVAAPGATAEVGKHHANISSL